VAAGDYGAGRGRWGRGEERGGGNLKAEQDEEGWAGISACGNGRTRITMSSTGNW